MKGRKGSVDEGGLRSPLVMRWPGVIRCGSRVTQIAGAIDLLPTLTDLAGVPLRSKKPLDGKSLKPLVTGEAKNWPDRMLFSLQGKRISVRTQQYRLDPEGQLFDITRDPGQERNIAAEQPEVAARLKKAAAEWAKEVLPKVGPDDRPFPVGYARTTLLPARDGVASGSIQRSAKPPNSSYFTNWTSKDDRISWDIEVGQAGRYRAELYYTCRREDVGAEVELSFQGAQTRAKISVAHDPPLIGAAEDRVERGESYTKDFKPLPLGAIELKKARGKLELRAVEIPGKQVADVRYVVLTRI
jgi:hypothetical protein